MQCDGCTLCCKLVDVPWMESPAGEYCRECIIGEGCKIYADAPDLCLRYDCAYSQTVKASEKFRPDNCHVIFEKITPDIMTGLIDPEFKKEAIPLVKDQLLSFTEEGLSIVLSVPGDPTPLVVPAKGKNPKEIYAKAKLTIMTNRNGGSSLRN